eukprot:2701132-Pyramimonas_sp.AAC.1
MGRERLTGRGEYQQNQARGHLRVAVATAVRAVDDKRHPLFDCVGVAQGGAVRKIKKLVVRH